MRAHAEPVSDAFNYVDQDLVNMAPGGVREDIFIKDSNLFLNKWGSVNDGAERGVADKVGPTDEGENNHLSC